MNTTERDISKWYEGDGKTNRKGIRSSGEKQRIQEIQEIQVVDRDSASEKEVAQEIIVR